MPFDGKGKHHLNTQKAMASDKMPRKSPVHAQSGEGAPGVQDSQPDQDMGDSTRTIISHNDDGSHMVMHHDGEETGPHNDIEEALEHIRMKHGAQAHPGPGDGIHHMPEPAMHGM